MTRKFSIRIFMTFLAVFLGLQPVFTKNCLIETGTKVRLKLTEKVASNINQEGDEVTFAVFDDVTEGDNILIKAGSTAIGVVSKIKTKDFFGKEGSIIIDISSTKSVDGTKIPLSGQIEDYGTSRSTVTGIIGIVILPYVIFSKGNDASIPEGYVYTARVAKDMNINLTSKPAL
jgi:hypothetical protein